MKNIYYVGIIIGLLIISGCGSSFEIPSDNLPEEQRLLDRCLDMVAREKKDESICGKIGESLILGGQPYKSYCYSAIARLKKNVTICENIQDDLYRKSCKSGYERSLEETPQKEDIDCEKIKEEYKKEHCYADLAAATGNIDICDKIKTEWIIELCYLKMVSATGNREICENKIFDLDTKRTCLFRYAAYLKDENLCYELIK